MKKVLLQATVAVGILLAIFGVNAYVVARTPLSEARSIGHNVSTFKELNDRFQKLANDKGAVYAFNVLRIATVPPNTDMHLLGHAIGDILYKQKGVAGMADCTQEFRNACSHSIVIGSLVEYGEAGALPLIHEACLKAPGGPGAYTMCYHGLGHGVFAYFGYDLAKTVALCKKMGTAAYGNQEYTQCVGGAIMELVGGGGHDHDLWLVAQKKYLTADPLSPCMSALVPYEAKTMCLMYITPRLFTLAGADLGSPDPATFPKAFSFCDALPVADSKLRDSCYGGLGKEFVPMVGSRDIRAVDLFSNAQYITAINYCNAAGPKDGKEFCVQSELDSIFWGGENTPDASFRFCSLAGTFKDVCYAKLSEQITLYVGGERGVALCNRLPDKFIKECTTKVSSGKQMPGIVRAVTS